MFDSRKLAELLVELYRRQGPIAQEDEADLVETAATNVIDVSYTVYEVELVDTKDVRLGNRFWGLDASVRTFRVTGIDIVITTGALVGNRIVTVPGVVNTRWIAVRPRYVADSEVKNILVEWSKVFYTCSRFIDEVFDGKFNEDVMKDEVRISLENVLLNTWPGEGYLIIDGPLFPTPRILTRPDFRYSRVYLGLIKERVNILKSRNFENKVISVVKRLSHSRYLAQMHGLSVTDDQAALLYTRDLLESSSRGVAYIGTLCIRVRVGDEEYEKYVGYLVKRTHHVRHVVRIEALSEETLHELKPYVAALLDPEGLPIPVHLADRLCKDLSGGVYRYLWSVVPVDPTFESLEELMLILSQEREEVSGI